MRAAGPLVLALLLAGCSAGTTSDTVEAKEAADASVAAVEGRFDYLLFLGITGTEGPLNWTQYEEALEASDFGAQIADAFDQDLPHGEAGDGELGSWLSTHFVYDEDRQLLGGLYTQFTPGSEPSSVYAPFLGPYQGTPGLPALQPQGSLPSLLSRAQGDAQGAGNGTVLCGLVSTTDHWEIDSRAAAAIAAQRPLMEAHTDAYPDGEYTYYYFPGLDVEPGCLAKIDTRSNYWVISHVDLDEYLMGGVPTVAEVHIDAATGEVLEEHVTPLYERIPEFRELTLEDIDTLVPPSRVVRNVTFLVDPLVSTLDIRVDRLAHPTLERSAATRLIDPAGRIWDRHEFDDDSHGYRVTKAAPGQWTLEYIHQPLEPGGGHELRIHVMSHYG